MWKLVITIFAAVIFLLYSHGLILYGAVKERARRICIDPATETRLNKVIETTTAICTEISTARLLEVNEEIKKQKGNAAYWQKQFNSCPTSTPAI